MTGSRVLEARNLAAGYGDLKVLHDVNVHVDRGELVTLIGPNGAGKSTLLKAVFGLLPATSGHVLLEGRDVTGAPSHERVRRGIAYVPQLDNVFPNLTVRENLELGAYQRPNHEVPAALEAAWSRFPMLRARAREKCGRLSGGQRQLVAMARALMMEPRLLLLDEPSAGLAPNLAEDVLDQAVGIARAGTPVLLVEQNAKKALARSDRGYVLDAGRNKYEGPGPALLADPNVGRLYLGG